MAGDRTLKLSILGDVSNLVKSLNQGTKEVDGFGTQIADISAKVVKSFAAIGTAVGAASLAFAKAAAEDQEAAQSLERTLNAVTKATTEQIGAVEDYITQVSLQTGITDDQLRPAFERLARSTKDVENATNLLNLALDLSAATGKPLELVVNALGKAYDGNTTSLGRLGLGIDSALLKSKDFNAIYEYLNETFGEFSEQRSEEAIVKFQRLQVAVSEAKEQVGAALLPAFEALGDWLLKDGVPRLNAFIAGLTGDRSLRKGFTEAEKSANNFGSSTRNVIEKLIEYKEVATTAAAITASIWAVAKIQAAVVATIGFINALIAAYNALKTSAIVAAVASRMALNPLLGAAASTAVLAAVGLAAKAASDMDVDKANANIEGGVGLGNRPLGGRVGSTPAATLSAGAGLTGMKVPSVPAKTTSGESTISRRRNEPLPVSPIPNAQLGGEGDYLDALTGRPINIVVNGAIDPVGTARTIQKILTDETNLAGNFYGGIGNSRFATRPDV